MVRVVRQSAVPWARSAKRDSVGIRVPHIDVAPRVVRLVPRASTTRVYQPVHCLCRFVTARGVKKGTCAPTGSVCWIATRHWLHVTTTRVAMITRHAQWEHAPPTVHLALYHRVSNAVFRRVVTVVARPRKNAWRVCAKTHVCLIRHGVVRASAALTPMRRVWQVARVVLCVLALLPNVARHAATQVKYAMRARVLNSACRISTTAVTTRVVTATRRV